MAYKKYTAEETKAWKNELVNKVDSFLKDALETKDGFDRLTAHYRISGLYSYSFYNNMMIYSQGGKICQSKANWAKFDRTVIKGQRKNIYVWMPIFKFETLADGTKEKTFVGCKLVGTWDVSQTEGKALEYDHNSEEMDIDYTKVVKALEELTDAKIIETITGNARGVSNGEDMKVSEWSNDTDKAKTAFHEVAHHLLHTSDKVKKDAEKLSYATCECEAESVAYLVMSYLGIDFELSKQYVASYKAGIADVRTKKIVDTADKIIKKVKEHISEEEIFLGKL